MKIISNGVNGWMVIPGQGVVEIPSDQLAAQAQQMNPLSSMKFDEDKFDITMTSNDEHNILTVVEKTGEDRTPKMIYFNKNTHLIDQLDVDVTGLNTVTKVSDYKEFDKILLPTKMVTSVDGKVMAEIAITAFEVGYPAPDLLFVKPE